MDVLPKKLREVLHKPHAIRILATVGRDGVPDVVLRDSLVALDDHTLAFAETSDADQSSQNLTQAIWYDGAVAVSVVHGARAWRIRARPWRCLIAGPVFKRFLLAARVARGPDADIAAVWLLHADTVSDESLAAQLERDVAQRPFAGAHLDCARFVAENA